MEKQRKKALTPSFIIGDEWLYYKIYTGYNTAENILKEVIKPISSKLIKQKKIDKWFFIRYSDPKSHIRLRYHIPKNENITEIINTLNPYLKKYLKNDLIWNIQVDTYQREIQRYGLHTMELSEDLFFHDSVLVVNFINLIEGFEGEELRWLFSLKAIDCLLTDFKFSTDEKIVLMERLKNAYANEFGMTKSLKNQINSKYAIKRNQIISFLSDLEIDGNRYYEIEKILNKKSKNVTPTITKILEIYQSKKNNVEINHFLSSHIHMLANRIFKSKSRLNEMVVYNFLFKYYMYLKAKKQ